MNSPNNFTSRNCTSVGNGTACDVSVPLPPWYDSYFNIGMVVIYALAIIAALIGNILVCLAVRINSNLRHNVHSYFIISLAVSDIGTTCLSMTFDLEQFITNGKWYHGEALCVIWTTAYLITVPTSIWNLFVLSIDRYKTLKNPWSKFKESHSMTARRALITITISWIYCFAFALLPVMGWKTYPKSVEDDYCRFNIAVEFSIVGSVFNFYLPMFAMCYIYYKVYQIAHAHAKFPSALKSRYDTGSGHGSGASTLPPLENLGRASLSNQHCTPYSANQESENRDVVGLENVSFSLEEIAGKKSIGLERQSTEKEPAHGSVCALRANTSTDPAEVERERMARHADSFRYGLETIKHLETENLEGNKTFKDRSDAEKRTQRPKNENSRSGSDESMLSTKEISTLKSEMHCSVERDECAIKENSPGEINQKSATDIIIFHSSNAGETDIEKITTGQNENNKEKEGSSAENAQVTSLSSNSFKPTGVFTASRQEDKREKAKPTDVRNSDNPLCKRNAKFPLAKVLKRSSKAKNDDESCSLRKFHKRSTEAEPDKCIAASSTCFPPGELSARTLNRERDSLTDQQRLKYLSKNTKAARTISIIVGAFLVCWIPFTTASIMFNICGVPCYTIISPKVFHLLLWLGYVNSALNPILFSYRNMQYRKSYRQIAYTLFPCLKKQGQQDQCSKGLH